MRVLITGAAGMLGVDVRRAALAAGHEVVALSRAALDIGDGVAVGAVLEAVRPDAVINCAAYTKVDAAEADVPGASWVNARGPAEIGAAAVAIGAWVVHVSTDYVFAGDKTDGPYVESDPVGPRSVYGATKLAGEQGLAAVAPESHTIVRSSWLFGSAGPCFPATILRAARERPSLRVVDDQIGCPTYTPHLAAALLELAERRDLVGLAHVAAGGQCSWFEFASTLVTAARAWGASAAGGDPAVDDRGAAGEGWATVSPCASSEYPTPASRPAFSVLRSERDGVPVLPEWQVGLSEYMTARFGAEVSV